MGTLIYLPDNMDLQKMIVFDEHDATVMAKINHFEVRYGIVGGYLASNGMYVHGHDGTISLTLRMQLTYPQRDPFKTPEQRMLEEKNDAPG